MRSLILTTSLISLACGPALCSDPDKCRVPKCLDHVGGSTVAAKVYRDIFNCYSSRANGVFSTSATYTSSYNIQYPARENAACTLQGTADQVILYEPVGSDAGLAAFTAANPSNWGTPATTNTVAFLDSAVGVTSTPYTQIQFSASDTCLNSTQLSQAKGAVGEAVFQLPSFAMPVTLPLAMCRT